ncbi:putative ubiquitin-like-specific protease 1B [Venturia canescens]|uniref:putative ubiquitin-like-specific protease 1B n=1 Tax=Venturia canescens TaxID=32260 RepID=UPI001C9C3599|nr:putative ubiquitin-like-specific protease 1B [Venturia canescens]
MSSRHSTTDTRTRRTWFLAAENRKYENSEGLRNFLGVNTGMKMDASTQTDEVVRKHFSQQTDGEKGKWVNEDKEVEIVQEIKGRKDEDDISIIAVFHPISSMKKRTRDVKTQTASSTKEKGMQTEWMLHVTEIEESRRSNRDLLLRFIKRQWNLIEVREAVKVPVMLSPIREFEEKAEEWKTWGAGEFRWDDNTEKNENKKKGTNDDREKKQTKRIKEEAERKDKENIENKNDNNNIGNSKHERKRTNDKEERQIKEIIKEDKGNNTNNDVNNEKKRKSDNDDGQTKTKKIKREIKQQDLETLNGTNWLNDEVINNYLELISDEKTYAMSSFFFPRLHVNGYEAVKRWTRKVNIFKFEKMIVPINLGNHWCLAVIDFLARNIVYYDSFGRENPKYLITLQNYLVEEAKNKGEGPIQIEEWSLVTKMNIPRQTNGYDCGVFVCLYAKHVIERKEMNFSQQEMPQKRRQIRRELETGIIES